jgi:hypothetical protein
MIKAGDTSAESTKQLKPSPEQPLDVYSDMVICKNVGESHDRSASAKKHSEGPDEVSDYFFQDRQDRKSVT